MPERAGILGGDSSGTSLVDLLDRVLHRGAYISGDVTICLAGIDLVRLDLRLLLAGIEPTPDRETDRPRPSRQVDRHSGPRGVSA